MSNTGKRDMNLRVVITALVTLVLLACGEKTPPSDPVKQEAQTGQSQDGGEWRKHFDQAFAYVGSAHAAASAAQRESLYLAAEKEFTNAIELRKDYAEAYLNRGVLYIAMGKLNKAESDLTKARDLEPANAEVSYNLACLYSLAGKLDLALDALDNSLKLGFNNPDRLRNDPDLASLRELKEFKTVLERYKFFLD